MTGNATISVTHTVIMDEFEEDVLGNEEVIANVKRFLRDGCGCCRGVKGGPCCQQFSEKLVLSNVNNCLELTRSELDLVILANIQAVAKIDLVGEKGKKDRDAAFYFKIFRSARICFYISMV